MKRSLFMLAALGLSMALPAAADMEVDKYNVAVSVDPGKDVIVGRHSMPWYPSCSDSGVKIVVTTPPEHGKVSMKPGSYVFSKGMPVQCLGKTVDGTFVWYTANPDYHGPDRFVYTSEYKTVIYEATVTVTVN